jgi:asparagine synthase (glutamine-hydrolysing)
MCGLVGVLDRRGAAKRFRGSLQRAADAIAHRGPDDEGFWFEGAVGLGFRRLSILDLTVAGHQPMHSQNGEWTLVFNGEIYNFIELQRELEGQGVRFRSHSDTEVLVEALAHWGTRAFERCNGMWAVLAWHAPTRTLYACRDPWGIKPLFISDQGDWLGFSSEIKGLRALGCQHQGVQPLAARRYLDAGLLDTDHHTMFTGYERLLPGHLHAWRDGQLVLQQKLADGTQSIDLPRFPDDERGEADFQAAFREALLSAVRLRLRADVDVGTCLSGGLDSTTIACAAARFLTAERVTTCRHAFTALLPEFDESQYIRPVLAQTGAEWHITLAADSQISEKAARFFMTHDEPVHSLSPFAGYLVMELAAKANVKVLLNGQGADELLAGYSSTVAPFLRSVLHQDGVGEALRQAKMEAGSALAGTALLARSAGSAAARALFPGGEAWWRQQREHFSGGSANLKVPNDGPLGPPRPELQPPSHSLSAALDDQVTRSPLPLFLRIEDANSSAFSLEARLPFLDPVVVALARKAPARLLRRNGLNKYLLRSILPGLVPEVVWQRREKMGFPVPNERWMRGPLRTVLLDTLSEERLKARGWYNVKEVVRARDRLFDDVSAEPSGRLRSLFLLERWARDHLDTPVPSPF